MNGAGLPVNDRLSELAYKVEKSRKYNYSTWRCATAGVLLAIGAIVLSVGLSVGLYRLIVPSTGVVNADTIQSPSLGEITIASRVIIAEGKNFTFEVETGDTTTMTSDGITTPAVTSTGPIIASGTVTTPNVIKDTSTAQSTSNTLTAALLLNPGLVVLSTAGGAVTLTLPTAASLVALLDDVAVGDVVTFVVVAQGHATNAVVLAAAGSDQTYAGDYATRFVAAGSARVVSIRFTNVSSGTEAYTVI